jgi:hypothetical protein
MRGESGNAIAPPSPLSSPIRVIQKIRVIRGQIAFAVLGALVLSAMPAQAQWPFSTPFGAATPFAGFSDTPAPDSSGGPQLADIPLVPVPFEQLSNQTVDDLGQVALSIKPGDWKHAETDHFIIHYRRVTEAERVVREVEFDLTFVANYLGAKPEQYAKKSHVFIFEDQNEWQGFLNQTQVPPWAASFAHGDELFLNLRSDTPGGPPFDSHTLAHETTHAVVARLYPGKHWPLWLNEGLAEYMGGAAVAKMKNQPIRRHEHTLTFAGMSLDQLQQMQVYPQDPVQVAELYETSEKLIRFIMTELPRERFTQFIDSVLSGHTLQQALLQVYGDKLASYDDFEKKYARFTK